MERNHAKTERRLIKESRTSRSAALILRLLKKYDDLIRARATHNARDYQVDAEHLRREGVAAFLETIFDPALRMDHGSTLGAYAIGRMEEKMKAIALQPPLEPPVSSELSEIIEQWLGAHATTPRQRYLPLNDHLRRKRKRATALKAVRDEALQLSEWILMNQKQRAAVKVGGMGLCALGTLFEIKGNPISQRKAFLQLSAALFRAQHPEISCELQRIECGEERERELGSDTEKWRRAVMSVIPDHRTWCRLSNNRRISLKIRGVGLVAIARIFGISEGNPLMHKSVFHDLGNRIFGAERSTPLIPEKRHEIADRIRREVRRIMNGQERNEVLNQVLQDDSETTLFFALANADVLDERERQILREYYLRTDVIRHPPLRSIKKSLPFSAQHAGRIRDTAVRKLAHLLTHSK
ncbi:MAG: hypothetical protein PHE68_00775 [Candidatus Peribacteraceae bacterium]|nr:hypothetical protein [Candidatus Peribacteraceae bacterium]MDD5074330.1 hypothetical protein [Candidatus Peribacteraceae bacterium]